MRIPTVMLLVSVCGASVAAGDDGTPFRIPPNGQPEKLIGKIAFEAPSALAFDAKNRPYMFNTREPESFGFILTLRGGRWVRLSYLEALKKTRPNVIPPTSRWHHALGTIAVDDAGGLYAVIYIQEAGGTGRRPVLLYSPDLGATFQAYDVPGDPGRAFLEIDTGCTDTSLPPAIGLLRFRQKYPTQWTDYHDLFVLVPEKDGDRLRLPEPVLVTHDCFGVANHSGGYSFAATTGNRTHVVYAEIPKKGSTGNPTFVATYDRAKREVTAQQFLLTAPPSAADVHSAPVIAADDKGHLHVVSGAHNNPFLYARSLKPDDIAGGWTKPVAVGASQTYATLACGPGDRLHTIYRIHGGLYHQQKEADAAGWSKRRTLVQAPASHSGYTIFYHRLFVDRRGAFYLSFTFWETRTQQEGRYPRALAVSEDGGVTWQLATTDTFMRRSAGTDKQVGEDGGSN